MDFQLGLFGTVDMALAFGEKPQSTAKITCHFRTWVLGTGGAKMERYATDLTLSFGFCVLD